MKVQYHTKNYDELLAYLKSIPGRHITVQEICAHFANRENPMGMTTVYRQMERLVEQGLVQKYTLQNNESACFEYTGQEVSSRTGTRKYHCKCTSCGCLIHLECDEIDKLEKHILEEHSFTVDAGRTVFYGLCEKCR